MFCVKKIILDGLPLHIVDTAGLRDTDDIVEKEGIRRAKIAIEQADLVLYMMDVSSSKAINTVLADLSRIMSKTTPSILIINKIDLQQPIAMESIDSHRCIHISVKERWGLDALIDNIKETVGYRTSAEGDFIARRRHVDALYQATQHVEKGLQQLAYHHAPELFAEDLRLAQETLNTITGVFTSDDLLGEIFSSFCIGK